MLKASGYQHTFIVWGIIQGVVVLAASLFLGQAASGMDAAELEGERSKDQGAR